MATQTITNEGDTHQCEPIDCSNGKTDARDASPSSSSTIQELGEIVGKSTTKRSPRDAAKDLGYAIAKTGKIKQISSKCWIVPSQSGNGAYEVSIDDGKISCSCPQWRFRCFRVGFCKHQWAVKYYLAMQEENNEYANTKPNDTITNTIECKFCKSTNCIKYGKHGKRRKQVWQCKDCDTTFIPDDAFRRMKYDPKVISLSLSMYFRGMSLRSISATLRETFSIKLSHQTVHNWIDKYAEMLTKYIESLVPHFSGQINADELYVFIRDDLWYWFIAIDPDTRLMLATAVSERKDTGGAVELFEKAKLTIRDQMLIKVITDGLAAYRKGFKKVFFSKDHRYREHETAIRLNGDINNNIMERVNNTVRDREKCFRRLKSKDSPIFKMYPIYYNEIKKHQALNGLTPAQASGICTDLGRDKWLGLIRKAHEAQKSNSDPIDPREKNPCRIDSYCGSCTLSDKVDNVATTTEPTEIDPTIITASLNPETNKKRQKILAAWNNKGWL